MTKRMDAHITNPCLKEQDQSYECLSRNAYDSDKCQKYFDNYNICKKFWGKVTKDRRQKGITPYLPDVEQREHIKKEFMEKVKDGI